jgi:NADH-quinone oxidoreductase subunit J
MHTTVFAISALIVLLGALGVVFSRNPVHSALSLVATFFGIAVLFVNLNAQLLAAVQVIVYTGAIVVLILFVIMLLGVDREEDFGTDPLVSLRAVGVAVGLILAVGLSAVLIIGGTDLVTGEASSTAPISAQAAQTPGSDVAARGALVIQTADGPNINRIGEQLFTRYVFAFEITAALLTIAVVGAVVLARRPKGVEPLPERESLENGADLAAVDAEGEHG